MARKSIYDMKFKDVYEALVLKVQKKNKTRQEVDEITAWLTGYDADEINKLLNSDVKYGQFFENAPKPNPFRKEIKGSICGVKIQDIEEPIMREIRYLDKLVDELAKGKSLENLLKY